MVFWILVVPIFAAPRADDWEKVAKAFNDKLPKTALELLKPIETAAFADQAWGEGTKALLMRVRLQNGVGFSADLFPPRKKVRKTGKVAENQNADPFAEPHVKDPFVSDPFSTETEELGLSACVQQLDSEIVAAPPAVRPILRWYQARWLRAYYDENHHQIDDRSEIAGPQSDDISTWDRSRVLSEIDKCFKQALAERDTLQKIPVGVFRDEIGRAHV